MPDNPLVSLHESAGAAFTERGGVRVPAQFGRGEGEYKAALSGAALHDRTYRGLIEVTGADRAAWLNNLVTNVIQTLRPGDGNYAFGLNAKGRILFDANMLVLPDAIWLDVERSCVPAMLPHLDRYVITEDVHVADRSDTFARLGLLGPRVASILAALGATNAPAMAQLQHGVLPLGGKHRPFVRHDLAGVFGVELYVHADDAAACWSRLLEIGKPVGLQPVGLAAVQALRIEAGIPWWGDDIDDDVLPAETRQTERGVSFTKGCYLGQEVVERMRSRGALARTLVGVRIDADAPPPSCPARLHAAGADVGRLTSVCHSPHAGELVGLGYVKTAVAAPGTEVTIETDGASRSGRLASLPFRS